MRYYHRILIFSVLMSSLVTEAQTDVTIRKRDFSIKKSGSDEAWKHVIEGDKYYSEKGIWYSNAFREYVKASGYNSSNAELNYKAGVSALFSDNKEKAAGFLIKALELNKNVAEDVLFLAGRSLQYSGRFSEAIEKFKSYIGSVADKPEQNVRMANKYIEECNSALIITTDTLRIEIVNAGANINSGSDEYSGLISDDGKNMFFASRRKLPKSHRNYSDSKFDENIFISKRIGDSWEEASLAGEALITAYCETPVYLNSTDDTLYIYAGYENGGDVKRSFKKKEEWKSPQPIPFGINSRGNETSFTFSPSGREIYFVSDMKQDNYGGKDIYFIRKINNSKWTKPQNAGPVINSAYDEESVRFSVTGDTLWFSSQGHNSIGGFDIFYCVRNQAGEWVSLRNYGYPVNTPSDDFFYYPSQGDNRTFYFASNRSGGFGGFDIYRGRILPADPPLPFSDTVSAKIEIIAPPVVPAVIPEAEKVRMLNLNGKVSDSETGEPVPANIDIIDFNTDSVIVSGARSDADGSYLVRIPYVKSFLIAMRASGFLSDLKRVDMPDTYFKDSFTLDVTLTKVKVGKKVVLNNILFETGKSVLAAGSYTELGRLLNIMLDNPKIRIEISGHTDNTGNQQTNLKLSEQRALAVAQYLGKKGVDPSRTDYKGYGSLQPVADNTTPQGRARNRRVEFKILEF